MPAYVFDQILLKGVREGQIPNRTKAARNWFRSQASRTRVTPNRIVEHDDAVFRKHVQVGRMYMFFYDPKHKKTLPYYDTFPLIFPFKKTNKGFLGINLHYLPLTMRAKLMDALYEITNNDRYDKSTKLQISYNILNSASRFKFFRPCIKQYLSNHVKSRFVNIQASDWDTALWLPVERFKKQSKDQVWKDSRKIIKKAK